MLWKGPVQSPDPLPKLRSLGSSVWTGRSLLRGAKADCAGLCLANVAGDQRKMTEITKLLGLTQVHLTSLKMALLSPKGEDHPSLLGWPFLKSSVLKKYTPKRKREIKKDKKKKEMKSSGFHRPGNLWKNSLTYILSK